MRIMNPYISEGNTVLSFSGGRTSGLLLWRVIQGHGGELPSNVRVVFCNTGKERPETLDFVRDCGEHWGVEIIWLEFDPSADGNFRIVTYETASRHGEPFTALLNKKSYLPNPVTRFCTIELKIRVIRDYCRSIGWDHWYSMIGLRADEMGRVESAIGRTSERWTNVCPLASAGVIEADVMAFWGAQNFNLRLVSFEGNCDLCFLKGKRKIIRILQEHPSLGRWWAEAEAEAEARGAKESGARFRNDRPSYAELMDIASRQGWMRFDDQDITEDLEESCGDECHAVDYGEGA
jgi:3'-phosphoadenosine 5'-phosphosulfate sulfotransferase (PAPS reductase)/FAD synthetase